MRTAIVFSFALWCGYVYGSIVSTRTSPNACSVGRWDVISDGSTGPVNIGAHSMVARANGASCTVNLYVFGGFLESYDPSNYTFYSDLWNFKVQARKWTKIVSSPSPAARAFHGAADAGGKMFVFGGLTYTTSFFITALYGDLWAFDYSSNSWSNITVAGGPSPRGDMRLTYMNGKLYVFAGVINGFFTMVNDLWSFDIVTRVWTQLLANGAAGSPSARITYQMVAIPEEDVLFLYGGEGPASLGFPTLNDTWIYKADTNTWQDITPTGAGNRSPAVDNFSGTVAVGTLVFQYGGEADTDPMQCDNFPFPQQPTNGSWAFETDGCRTGDGIWVQKHFTTTTPPVKRNAMAVAPGCNCVYNFGGYNTFCPGPPNQVWDNNVYITKVLTQ